ncbi:hypothetical protein EDEG_01721 [Edhazardia aedis USNM 41457]|uniref:Uncharacterized protein n=1 Tax=Edhazardia aedis (strain USNM 41457) TaxID=1003232 RepID=J8ZWB5_EDHAE|nr:hypothetical protein EDEG_01721 [Edhazardia aedis USNM 41457]|eukprot:EJW03988.1 hypothetical protein EDEG_01721 [Edhazardia aedis USNM 41457]
MKIDDLLDVSIHTTKTESEKNMIDDSKISDKSSWLENKIPENVTFYSYITTTIETIITPHKTIFVTETPFTSYVTTTEEFLTTPLATVYIADFQNKTEKDNIKNNAYKTLQHKKNLKQIVLIII